MKADLYLQNIRFEVLTLKEVISEENEFFLRLLNKGKGIVFKKCTTASCLDSAADTSCTHK